MTIFNWCVAQLASEVQSCFYVMPSYAQAKKVIWDSVTNDGLRIIDYFPKEIIAQKNVQEMKIRLVNGSLFQLIGSDNIDSLMGTNPKIVVFSEYAIQDPLAWEYISPILRVNGGTAIFISTPRGRNHFYDLFSRAKVTEGWFCERLTINDTGVLNEHDMDIERADGRSEETIQQEYYCSFDRGVEGSYYALLLKNMHDQGRICPINHDPYKMVHTAWDLGFGDATAIIFFQTDGSRVNIIDCEEHNNCTLAWYKELLMKKGYKYGTHLLPHDVDSVDGLSTGCTRREFLEDLGIPVTKVERAYIHDGIETVKRMLSSRIYINSEKCQPLLKSLESYHREWDDKLKTYKQKPKHDWSSHYADAMRYLSQGLKFVEGTDKDLKSDYDALKKYWG